MNPRRRHKATMSSMRLGVEEVLDSLMSIGLGIGGVVGNPKHGTLTRF